MNQTLPTADLNTAGTTDVIPSVAIDRIIAQRNEGIALFMQAMECLATARKILLDASGDIFLYGFEDCVTDSVRRIDKPEKRKGYHPSCRPENLGPPDDRYGHVHLHEFMPA
ncbi:hypothetical protein EC2720900_5496 [Escherichia coli 2720900]|nr:hypothetical protein EC2720900_5496 [Escherichia coli 2720900]